MKLTSAQRATLELLKQHEQYEREYPLPKGGRTEPRLHRSVVRALARRGFVWRIPGGAWRLTESGRALFVGGGR